MYQIDCEPTCGFSVRSHDRDEAIGITLDHARTVHDETEMTREDVAKDVREVEPQQMR